MSRCQGQNPPALTVPQVDVRLRGSRPRRAERRTELGVRVRHPGDARIVAMPAYVAVRGQPDRAALLAIEDVDGAGIHDVVDVLVRHADREVVLAVVVEVSRRERPAEAVVILRAACDVVVLVPEVGARRAEPPGRSVEHVHRAGIPVAIEVLPWRADRQIGVEVAVEVASRQGGAEAVAIRGAIRDPGRGLREERVGHRIQPVLGAEHHHDRAGRHGVPRRNLARHSDREVVESVAVEIPGRQHRSEVVAFLQRVLHPERVLRQDLVEVLRPSALP
jgi:hypothetical protein